MFLWGVMLRVEAGEEARMNNPRRLAVDPCCKPWGIVGRFDSPQMMYPEGQTIMGFPFSLPTLVLLP